MHEPAFQDQFPPSYVHCYGCGRENEQGFQIKSRWDGDESVCLFDPQPYHTAYPGIVYGGLIASLIDCHGVGTAAATRYRADGHAIGEGPDLRFVTASLHVDYLRPTPLGRLELRARVEEQQGRRALVVVYLYAGGELCARGEVVAVRLRTGEEKEP